VRPERPAAIDGFWYNSGFGKDRKNTRDAAGRTICKAASGGVEGRRDYEPCGETGGHGERDGQNSD
jgi:hypothetical protein